jgi:hypothetical protein
MRDHEETRMHSGAPRPEPGHVGVVKQGGRGGASWNERPDVTNCRDEVAVRRRAEPVRLKGGGGLAHTHNGDARVRACAYAGVRCWVSLSFAGARSQAAGRKQRPQPSGRAGNCAPS